MRGEKLSNACVQIRRGQVPGFREADAASSALARRAEAIKDGNMILGSGKEAIPPSRLQSTYEQMVPGERAAFSKGTRAELERIVGTNANDVSALNRLVKGEGDWNRDKLRTVFGTDKADRILNVLDAELTFQRTGGRVASGSDTALTNRFSQFLDEASKPATIPLEASVAGMAGRGAQKLVGAASKSRAEANAAQFAADLGRLSVAQGNKRDAIVQALMKRGTRRDVSPTVETIVRALLSASLPVTSRQLTGR